MSKIERTVAITGTLSKVDTNDTYPLISNQDIKGGYKAVKSITERDNIPQSFLEEGLIVYIENTNQEFLYTDNAWKEISKGGDTENKLINYETQFDENTETLTLLNGGEVSKDIIDISTADVKTNETYNGKEIYKRFRVFKNVTLPDKNTTWKDNITDALPTGSVIINSVVNYNDNSANVFTLSTFANDSDNFVVAVVRPNGGNLVVRAGGVYLDRTADFYMTLYYIKG